MRNASRFVLGLTLALGAWLFLGPNRIDAGDRHGGAHCPPNFKHKDPKCLFSAGPCYGYYPTCWRRWPDECEACPPCGFPDPAEGQILEDEAIEELAPSDATFPPPEQLEEAPLEAPGDEPAELPELESPSDSLPSDDDTSLPGDELPGDEPPADNGDKPAEEPGAEPTDDEPQRRSSGRPPELRFSERNVHVRILPAQSSKTPAASSRRRAGGEAPRSSAAPSTAQTSPRMRISPATVVRFREPGE